MNIKQNVREFLNNSFRIPCYQRGYKWGVARADKMTDAQILVRDIREAFIAEKEEYFIQGVTLYKKNDELVLVDGQQRTTTLFLLLSLLVDKETEQHYFFNGNKCRLNYDIRTSSLQYLETIFKDNSTRQPQCQDQYYFDRALETMSDELPKQEDIRNFLTYVLDHVMLFVIQIDEKVATDIFSKMNGQKAYMITDELIKADILCKASQANFTYPASSCTSVEDTLQHLKMAIKQEASIDWEQNALRSRFAREWDKWLYWWNRPDVKLFFHCNDNSLEWLMRLYCETHPDEDAYSYSNKEEEVAVIFKRFQNQFIQNELKAKQVFEDLRKLQKKFEYIYNDPICYNAVGLALSCLSKSSHLNILHYCINNFNKPSLLWKYSILRCADVSDKMIKDGDNDKIQTKLNELLTSMNSCFLYKEKDLYDDACIMLFLLNVSESNKRREKFNFFYYNPEKDVTEMFYKFRSLEHIWPKSKVLYEKDGEFYNQDGELFEGDRSNYLLRGDIEPMDSINPEDGKLSEHSLGNLVFLHLNDNEKLGPLDPEEKKSKYLFNLSGEPRVYSRTLIYTISQFAFGSWKLEDTKKRIAERQKSTLEAIKTVYLNEGVEF